MSEPYIGEIAIFAFGKTPIGYLPADGRSLNVNQYEALFALLGNKYGGDGRTTFCLPNLTHGTMMGVSKTDPDFAWAQQGRAETATLTEANLPLHNHTFNASTNPGTSHSPANALFSTIPATEGEYMLYAPPSNPGVTVAPAGLASTGAGTGFNIMSPYIGLQICICVDRGLFPPRP